jgi:hypothetical protein
MGIRQLTCKVEVDPLSLFLIYFNVPLLTARLHLADAAMEHPDNETLLAICRMQTDVSKEG